ncbi:MAG: carbohydrate kinase family protein [Nitrososphaerota archaeon]|nr:carbohydrate kinase family protein [Nitrososphaerota archaeon]
MKTLIGSYLDEARNLLEGKLREVSVVVMPDFFLDRFISLNLSLEAFHEKVAGVAGRKGGSIDGIPQTEFRGGNAINTAAALASLGLNVTPIICTDRLGLKLVKFYVKSRRVDLSHVKVFSKMSITTAIEFQAGDGKVNVMLRDVGSLADFSPQDLNEGDFEAIESADYVCVFNWAGTRRFGTELAETVFSRVKARGRGKTYIDTADPTPNREKAQNLIRKVLQTSLVDILSLNENEAVFYASHLNSETKSLRESLSFEYLAKESAKLLAKHFQARIDLHTTNFSATFKRDGEETAVPAFRVNVLRATGAGDAWNAGNIFGDAYGLSDGARLALANAVAAYYISNPEGKHPTRRQLLKFCNKIAREADQNR